MRRHPLIAGYALGLIPNMLASWFSIVYNDQSILHDYPAARPMFKLLQVVVNGSFFPIGIFLFRSPGGRLVALGVCR